MTARATPAVVTLFAVSPQPAPPYIDTNVRPLEHTMSNVGGQPVSATVLMFMLRGVAERWLADRGLSAPPPRREDIRAKPDGSEKCRRIVDDLGFAASLDYRAPDLTGRTAAATPQGVDIYFENAGGAVREAVWPHMNVGARVSVCGLVSGYNGADEAPAGSVHDFLMSLVNKRIRLEGFMNADHVESAFGAFERQMQGRLDTGQVRLSETAVEVSTTLRTPSSACSRGATSASSWSGSPLDPDHPSRRGGEERTSEAGIPPVVAS